MPAVWAYALYTPCGRLSDWFRAPADVPSPRPWGDYRTSDLAIQREYIGDLSAAATRDLFALARRDLGYHACCTSPQAELRDHELDPLDLADVPQIHPAE